MFSIALLTRIVTHLYVLETPNFLHIYSDHVAIIFQSLCIKPVLPTGSMILNIIRSDGESTMLSAHPISLYQTLKMTEYQNRWEWMPNSMHGVPLMWDKFWNYMISISAALAVLNLAPVYWLDGEYALKAYLHILFSGWTESDRDWLAQTIFRSSTALFIVNIVVSMGALYM
jgi:membrane-associated protease RseP (regulator of RpoE activity)